MTRAAAQLGSLLPFDPFAGASAVLRRVIGPSQDDVARAIGTVPGLLRGFEQVERTLSRAKSAGLNSSDVIALENAMKLWGRQVGPLLSPLGRAAERAIADGSLSMSAVPDWLRPLVTNSEGPQVAGLRGIRGIRGLGALGIGPVAVAAVALAAALIGAGLAANWLSKYYAQFQETLRLAQGPQTRVNMEMIRRGLNPDDPAPPPFEDPASPSRAIAAGFGFGTIALVALVFFALKRRSVRNG